MPPGITDDLRRVLRSFPFPVLLESGSEVNVSGDRDLTVLPARDAQALNKAQTVLAGDTPVALCGAAGMSVRLPDELRGLLAAVVTAMRRGQAVTLAPLGQQLTTQQAADLLGISRPTLIKLLEAGAASSGRPSTRPLQPADGSGLVAQQPRALWRCRTSAMPLSCCRSAGCCQAWVLAIRDRPVENGRPWRNSRRSTSSCATEACPRLIFSREPSTSPRKSRNGIGTYSSHGWRA